MLENFFLFFEKFSLIAGYFEPLAAFWSVAKFMALGLLLSLGVVWGCIQFKLFKRQNRYWNWAAKLYFLYIPVSFIVVGAGFGLLQYTQILSDKVIQRMLHPFKQEVLVHLQTLPPESNARLSLAALKTRIEDNLEQSLLAKRMHKALPSARRWMLETFVDFLADKLNTKASEWSGFDKETLSHLWNQDATELLDGPWLDDIFSRRLHQLIGGYQMTLLWLLCLLLLVPAADTALAKVLERRGRHAAA
ncbi:MAG: hypothetical protein FWD46_09545 [Cystobacterineae bacterium]|nr:hypothetical protein [Cystobacterineae bacterium]